MHVHVQGKSTMLADLAELPYSVIMHAVCLIALDVIDLKAVHVVTEKGKITTFRVIREH